jgi:hypothetical protein
MVSFYEYHLFVIKETTKLFPFINRMILSTEIQCVFVEVGTDMYMLFR